MMMMLGTLQSNGKYISGTYSGTIFVGMSHEHVHLACRRIALGWRVE